MIRLTSYLCALLSAGFATAAPAASSSTSAVSSSTVSAPPPASTLPTISLNPNGLINQPQPIRGKLGAPLLGPTDPEIVMQNLDFVAPPTTDHGSV